MRKGIVYLLACLIFVSCEENEEEAKKPLVKEEVEKVTYPDEIDFNYFFPIQPEPIVYVYSTNNNPLSEIFLKISTGKSGAEKVMSLEYYNSNLVLVEGYTIALDQGYKVINHMTSSNGIKFESKVAKSGFFPITLKDTSRFMVDFPTTNDTVVMLFEKDRLGKKINFKFNDSIDDCIAMNDHIRLTRLNTFTKKEDSNIGQVTSIFGKGVGNIAQISYGSTDTMKLVKTISIQEWENIVPQ